MNLGQTGRAALWLLASSTPTIAAAQVAEPAAAPVPDAEISDEPTLGDIVVAARKLGETQLTAPVTITAVTGGQLTQKGVVSAAELNGIVPGLVQMTGIGGVAATTFRGVGSNSALFAVESSVAYYQDGVYLGRPRDFQTPLYDIDHVELIKGTQSTLLGKNSTLGAISVVDRRPGDAFGYDLAYQHGFRFTTDRLDAAFNLPVSDTLSLRVAGLYANDAGYVRNAAGGRSPDTTDISGRFMARWRPAPGLDMLFAYQHDDRDQRGTNLELLKDPVGAIALRRRALGLGTDTPADRGNAAGGAAYGSAAAGSEPYDRQISNRLNLIVSYDLGGHTLTSQSAYVNWRARYLTDVDLTEVNLFASQDVQSSRQFTQEVRLASPAGNRLSYLVGGYYYHNEFGLDRRGTANSPTGLVATQPATSQFQGVFGQLFGDYRNIYALETDAYSLFGSATWRLSDAVDLGGGLRHTWEGKDATYRRTGTGRYGTLSFPPIAPTALSRDETALDFDASVRFRPMTGALLYATYAKGSKSGGFQEVPQIIAAAEYAGEVARTIELGAKVDFRRHANATLALFQTTIRDFQTNYTLVSGGVSSVFVGNADLRTRGVEASGNWRPVDVLVLSASAVYADARFLTFLGGTTRANAVVYPGMRAPRAPAFSGQLDATYTADLSDRLALALNANLIHAGDAYLNTANFATGDAPVSKAHQDLGARISIGDKRAGWEVSLIGNNLLDQDWATFANRLSADGTPTVATPALGQRSYLGILNRPRTLSLRVTLHR